jgi:hypothetical protein
MMFAARPIETPPGIRGAWLEGDRLYLWGNGVFAMDVAGGRATRLAEGDFGPAGCVWKSGLILASGDELVRLAAPRYAPAERIDSGVDAADCLPARILGREGVLVAHRGLQVRHYTAPEGAGGARWPYREIYSFYTASYQAGLIQADVDGNGRPDLFCGNYWIQSPRAYELPWRLFAINTWNEEPESARVRLARMGRSLVAAQGAMAPGRLAVFDPPTDPRRLWRETRLETLRRPAALAAGADFFVVGENAGPESRLLHWKRTVGDFRARLIHHGAPFTHVWIEPGGVLALGPGGLMRFTGPIE